MTYHVFGDTLNLTQPTKPITRLTLSTRGMYGSLVSRVVCRYKVVPNCYLFYVCCSCYHRCSQDFACTRAFTSFTKFVFSHEPLTCLTRVRLSVSTAPKH